MLLCLFLLFLLKTAAALSPSPSGYAAFKDFLKQEFSDENLDFWEEAQAFRAACEAGEPEKTCMSRVLCDSELPCTNCALLTRPAVTNRQMLS